MYYVTIKNAFRHYHSSASSYVVRISSALHLWSVYCGGHHFSLRATEVAPSSAPGWAISDFIVSPIPAEGFGFLMTQGL